MTALAFVFEVAVFKPTIKFKLQGVLHATSATGLGERMCEKLGVNRYFGLRADVFYGVAAVSALVVASTLVFLSHLVMSSAQAHRGAAQLAYTAAEQRVADLNRQVATARAARQVMEQARLAGFGPADWSLRRMDFRQAIMNRTTVNDLLSQIARGPRQLFGADDFDLSMKTAGGGLFETPVGSGSEQSVSVTLSGSLYFRVGAK